MKMRKFAEYLLYFSHLILPITSEKSQLTENDHSLRGRIGPKAGPLRGGLPVEDQQWTGHWDRGEFRHLQGPDLPHLAGQRNR